MIAPFGDIVAVNGNLRPCLSRRYDRISIFSSKDVAECAVAAGHPALSVFFPPQSFIAKVLTRHRFDLQPCSSHSLDPLNIGSVAYDDRRETCNGIRLK